MINSLLWLAAGICIVGGLASLLLGAAAVGLAVMAIGVGLGIAGDSAHHDPA